MNYYGVDSYGPAPEVLPVLKARWGVYPSHYTRYVGGAGGSTNAAEVAYQAGLGIRQAFVFNVRAGKQFSLLGAAAGHADGLAMLTAVYDVLPPAYNHLKPLVWRDIEDGQQIDLAYLLALCRTLESNNWPGGLYGPWSQGAYTAITDGLIGQVERQHRLLWCADWTGFVDPPGPSGWCASPSKDPSSIVAWQFAGEALGNLIDADLVTEEAYGLMLAPAKPPQYYVKVTCALKPLPAASHATSSIHTCYGGDVISKLGPTQTIRSELTGEPETWYQVETVGRDGKTYAGLLPASKVSSRHG